MSEESIKLWSEADAAKQRAKASPSRENIKRAEDAQASYDRYIKKTRSESKKDKRSSRRD